MKKQVLLLLTIFLVVSLRLLSQDVYYVTTGGSDTNDGLTWETSFQTIQHAINEASANDYEVWVAEGTYVPTECLSDDFGLQTDDVYKSFVMYSGVNVYGSFAGDETTSEIGVAGGRQLLGVDAWAFANQTILDGSSTNSYHVVWYGSNGFSDFTYEISILLSITIRIPNHLPEKAILDGFEITGGFANMDIKFENTDNAKRNYCHTIGGGVALVGNGEARNCNVHDNLAKYSGAGVGMFDGAELYSTIINNNECIGINFYDSGIFGIGAFDYWRTEGAGLGSFGSPDYTNYIDNCVISNNIGHANDNYPAAPSATNNKYNNGGGVYLGFSSITNTIVMGNTIAKNPAPYDEGAHASCGGGIYLFPQGSVISCKITDNGFIDDDAQNGAGIFVGDYGEEATDYSDIIIKDSYFYSNRAGGAVSIDSKYSTIENCIVANNIGSGIYGYGNCENSRTINSLVYNNSSAGWAQSNSSNNNNNEIISSTIVNNGTGISITNTNPHKVYNTVVWGNNSNPAVYDNTDVQNSAFSFTPPAGTNNIEISADNLAGPSFIFPSTTYGVGVADWETANWHISPNSSLIDIANYDLISDYSETDIDGFARMYGAATDIGAYEYFGPSIEFSTFSPSYNIGDDILSTAFIFSNGLIDQLCGIGYEFYRNDVLIDNISDYGTVTYSVRQTGDEYYDGEITTGSGMINVEILSEDISAFTLGIFDNYCIDRHRPIDITANVTVPGNYTMKMFIYSCSNAGEQTFTDFTAVSCDGLVHDDYVGETCDDPTELTSQTWSFAVIDPVGVSQQSIAETIFVSPNPTSGIFKISSNDVEMINIYNNIGQLVLSTKLNEIDMSNYPSGMYFVKIYVNNEVITRKLIKQ